MQNDIPAEAYQAYNDAGDPETNWKTWNGQPVPQFDEVTENVRAKWRAAAEHAYNRGRHDAFAAIARFSALELRDASERAPG